MLKRRQRQRARAGGAVYLATEEIVIKKTASAARLPDDTESGLIAGATFTSYATFT
jgi:hypothetical protein